MNKQKENTVSNRQIYEKFWYGVRPYRLLFFISYFCLISATVIGIFTPLFYKRFFDLLGNIQNKTDDIHTLVYTIIIIAVLNIISILFFQSGMFIYNIMESRVMARLRQISFDYMMLHSYSFFTNNFTGSLVQRVNRFSRSFERLSDSFAFNLVPLIITIIGSVIVTWFVAPLISLVIILWVISYSTFNVLFSRWKMKYDIQVSSTDSYVTGVLSDNITNHNAITLFTTYEKETNNFKEITNDQAEKTRFSWNLGQLTDAVQIVLISVVEFLAFYYTTIFWSKGLATIGTFVLIQVYIIALAQRLWGLNRIVRGIYESLADSREMVEILLTPHEVKDVIKAKDLKIVSGEISLKNVGFNFNETREVLKDINLKISAGEKIAFIGPSGAGKTTLIRLILRLYDLSSGHIEIDNQDISRVTQRSLHSQISLVPQDPILFHRTLLENIRYGRENASDEEVFRAAKLAHCNEFIDSLPLKYDTFVGERGIKLSGGERQRIAIARAILKNAPILILDEATSSLDSESEMLIQNALENLMKGKTVIVIAHRLSTIKKMDRIVVIAEGRITEEGTHGDLINSKSSLYNKLWTIQSGGFISDK
ncbi:MAG: ABC transporter ATP-binding protein [Candidatus Paceibacterota bacterium]